MSVSETVGARESLMRGSESHRSSQLESMRRRMASSSLGDEDSAGLGDPFAEIFARIASAEAPAPPEEVAAPESSVTEETEVSSEGADVEESDSQDGAEATAEIAPVTTAQTLLNTDSESVEVVEEEVVEIEVVVDEQLNGEGDEQAEQVDAEVLDVQSTETIQESLDTSVEEEVIPAETVVDQEVAVGVLQSNRRDRGEDDPEVDVANTTQTESKETETQATVTTKKADADAGDEQQRSGERSAPVAANTEGSVQRRRYSKGHDNHGSSNESTSSVDAATEGVGEAQNINGRGQELRSSHAASSRNGIDVSSLTPVSSSASAAVVAVAPAGALNSSSGSAAAATKGGGVGPNSASPSVTASAKGSDPAAPVESPSSNLRTSPTGPAKSDSAGTDTLSAVQRAKLVQRVSRGFQQLGSNGGQIRMRLAPDQLGSVQLQMKLQNGELSGTMVTQTEAASQALREQLPQLRSSLESQGIRLDRMDIQTEATVDAQDASMSDGRFGDASGQSGRGFDQRGQLADQRERSSWSDVRATPRGKPSGEPEVSTRSVSFAPAGAVDLKA